MAVAQFTRTDYTAAPTLYRRIARLCLDDTLVCGAWRLAFIQPRSKYDRLKRFHAYYVLFNGRQPVGKLRWQAENLYETHRLLADVLCECGMDTEARLVQGGAWRLSHTLEDYQRVPVLR